MVPIVPRMFAEVGMDVWGGISGGRGFFGGVMGADEGRWILWRGVFLC